MVWEVETYLLAGRHSEAEDLAYQVLAVLGKSKHRGSEAWLKYLLGEIQSRRDPSLSTQAEACYREALLLAQELGMYPLQAHCYLALGQIHTKCENIGAAQTELHRAIEHYGAMRMPFWLDRANLALTKIE